MPTPISFVSLYAIVTLTGCSGLSVDDTGRTLLGRSDSGTSTTGETLEICDDALDTTAPPVSGCIQETLSCGDTVTATTEGGGSLWNTDGYTGNFCFVPSTDYDGSERMWEFVQPADSWATVTLEHCNSAALSVMSWSEAGTCPEDGGVINRCEATNAGTWVNFFADSDQHWVIVVDTPAGEEGNFTLSVDCK